MSEIKEIQLAQWKFRCESCDIIFITPSFQIIKDDYGQVAGKETCPRCKKELPPGELIRNA